MKICTPLGILSFSFFPTSQLVKAVGITNRVYSQRTHHLIGYTLFADLDGHDVEEATRTAITAMKKMQLSCCAVIESSPGYTHLYCPVVRGRYGVMHFHQLTGSHHSIDKFLENGELTLRVSEKDGYIPRVARIITCDEHACHLSEGHVKVLETLHNIKFPRLLNSVMVKTVTEKKSYVTKKRR